MDTNWVPILIAAVFYMVIYAIWYSPILFGKEWAALSKVSSKDTGYGGKMYISTFICAAIMAWVLAKMIAYAGANTAYEGAVIGFLMWLGFVVTVSFTNVMWENRPWKLFFINAGCLLVTLVTMGAVLAL